MQRDEPIQEAVAGDGAQRVRIRFRGRHGGIEMERDEAQWRVFVGNELLHIIIVRPRTKRGTADHDRRINRAHGRRTQVIERGEAIGCHPWGRRTIRHIRGDLHA